MLIFPFLLLPILTLLFFWGLKAPFEYLRKESIILFLFLGVLFSTLYCIFDVFFVDKSIWVTYSFSLYFFNTFLTELVLPLLWCSLAFFVFVRSEISITTKKFPIFFLGFYIVFFPVNLFAYASNYPFFMIFIKPLLVAILICVVFICMGLFPQFLNKKRTISEYILYFGCSLLLLIMPYIVETTWFFLHRYPLWILPFSLYILLAILLPKYIQKKLT